MSPESSHVDRRRLKAAQELHDLLGNGITVIYIHAACALQIMADHPDQAAAALTTIKAVSKDVATEVRAVLDLLSGTPDRPPSAGLHRIHDLVESASGSGLTVDLKVSGSRPIPAAVDLAAYRIVQESLTNALRHAAPTTAAVRIGYEPGALALDITNAPPSAGRHQSATKLAGGGRGISGMRDRAAALGGVLHAGPLLGGGFRVQARLPIS